MFTRAYMADGLYQSAIVFYMIYSLFAPGNSVTANGLDVADNKRMGVYLASTAVMVVNFYILFNTYRWDWLMVLIVVISTLLIWFWTGVWTASTVGYQFYKAAPQVYGQLSFWAVLLLTVILALLPRFTLKSAQKMYRPRDVDIIREQMRMGKFDYLKDSDALITQPPEKVDSVASSEVTAQKLAGETGTIPEDERPFYPPSVAATGATRNTRSNNGSDGTNYTGHTSDSFERDRQPQPRPRFPRVNSDTDAQGRGSMDRPRPSFDRARASMDRIRPSFEQSRDFTSAAYLSRVESSQSGHRAHGFGKWKTRE